MTTSLAVINSDAAYVNGNLLTCAATTSIVSNAELAWANAAAAMTKPVWTGVGWSSSLPTTPVVCSGLVWTLIADTPTAAFHPVVVDASGNTAFYASSGLPTSLGGVNMCYNAVEAVWFAVKDTSATVARYVSSSAGMTSWSSHNETTSVVCYDVIHNGLAFGSNGRYVIIGAASSQGRVTTSDGAGEIYTGANVNATALTSVARNTSTNIVAVGCSSAGSAVAVSYSTDSGLTWTHAAASISTPALWIGTLNVSWCPALSKFVVSGLLSTGTMFWSTSSTGASWTAWAYTAQIISNPSNYSPSGRAAIGICSVGNTLVAPYATEPLGPGNFPQVGIAVSTTNGASWRPLPGGVVFPNLSRLRAIALVNRAAIVSRGAVSITGAIAALDKENAT